MYKLAADDEGKDGHKNGGNAEEKEPPHLTEPLLVLQWKALQSLP